jgi:hypothetical protein
MTPLADRTLQDDVSIYFVAHEPFAHLVQTLLPLTF